jgi:hypothetical protein
MARMSHDKADARDRAQTLIGLELRRYRRRLAQTAEDYIAMAHDKAVASGQPFDHVAIAEAAVDEARRTYVAAELEAGGDE